MFKHYKVEVTFNTNDPLYSRIEEYANSKGSSVEGEIEGIVTWGLWPHIRRNLDLLIRSRKACEYQDMRDAGKITADEYEAKMDELKKMDSVIDV